MNTYEREVKRLNSLANVHAIDLVEFRLMIVLVTMAEELGFPTSLPVSSKVLEALTGCSTKVVLRARTNLKKAGLLDFKNGGRNTPPVYTLAYMKEFSEGTLTGRLTGTLTGSLAGSLTGSNQKEKNVPLDAPLPPEPPIPPIIPPKKEKGTGPETGKASSGLPAEKEFLRIPSIKDKEFIVTEPMIAEFESFFPAVDIRNEVRKAASWIHANPKQRKTNVRRFLHNWLAKAQDRAHGTTSTPSRPTSNTTPHPRIKFFDGEQED